ncbi:MAG: DUF4065 domain-containing protein [Bifidobacterium sp.]|nr:DUF4065 domain-containing protein [Bifidobacterium sp.]
MMALDIANMFIIKYGKKEYLTNLKLNKLVYYAQAESLKATGKTLFDDHIEAWEYGPVERSVYNAFKGYGKRRVIRPAHVSTPPICDENTLRVIDRVAEHYGSLSAFDLVRFSHRPGSAWQKAFSPDVDNVITTEMIMNSTDGADRPDIRHSLAQGVATAEREYPNALRLLENS